MSHAQTISNNCPHPRIWLKEELLEPLHISGYRLAEDIDVPQSTITRLIQRRSRITPNLALKFEKYFALDAEFWLNIQKAMILCTHAFTKMSHISKASPNYRSLMKGITGKA